MEAVLGQLWGGGGGSAGALATVLGTVLGACVGAVLRQHWDSTVAVLGKLLERGNGRRQYWGKYWGQS